jgi:hypothetical protein
MANGIVEPDFSQGGAATPRVYSEYLTTLYRSETPALTQADIDTAVAVGISQAGFQAADTTLANAISAIISNNLPLKADLDAVTGKIPLSQIPPFSLTTSVPVANQAAMLALTAAQVQPGDLALRSDGAGTFMLMNANPSLLANWNLLPSPAYVPPPQNALTKTGTANLTTDGTGIVSIPHTLGFAPSYVGITVTGQTTQPLAVKVSAKSSTAITFYCWNTTTGALFSLATVAFDFYLVP